MLKNIYCLTVLLLIFVQNSFAQQPGGKLLDSVSSTKLQEVTISAMHINDSLLNAPASIGILSKNDLQRNNNTDISTQMNLIPGVFMQSANITTNRISIRGIGARTPYGTYKIRAFYGNIPLTSGDGETTIEDLDLENLKQIEVIKGPLSSIYGAGLGGAILITPEYNGPLGNTLRVSSTYGSYNLVKNSVNYNLNTKTASFNLGYHKLSTDGWRDNSAYDREAITLGGELFRKEKSKLTYFGNYTWLKAFIPSSISKKAFDENPKSAAPTWIAAQGYKEYKSVLGGLAYDFQIAENISNSTSVFVNYKDNYEPRPFDILGQYTFAYGARTQFSGDFELGKIKSKFSAGVEYFRDDYAGRTLENRYQQNNGLGTLQGGLLTSTQQNREFYNAFAQLRMQLSRKFEFQAGVNANKTKFDLTNSYPLENASAENYSYDAIWSPQASFLFKPDNLKTIYFSASRGFSLPSVEETLTASGTVNSDIKPESGYNFELGGKFYFFNRNLYTEISLYRMQINDLLVAERVGDDQYVGVNAGETIHQGIEFAANYNWRINSALTVNPYVGISAGDYEFKEFTDRENDYSGNKLTGVPATKANGGITLTTSSGWYLSGDYLYVDDIPLNDANSVFTDSYSVLNLKTGWRFLIFENLNAHLAAGINNVTDEKYASLVLPNATGVNGAQPRYYYPGLPVNYYGNVSVSYKF